MTTDSPLDQTGGGQSDAATRLATYGTLGPGRVNHHELADVPGRWLSGSVRGQLLDAGWGADLGYPGLVLDEAGAPVPVDVLESADLPNHWARLDTFEGPLYRRVATQVQTDSGPLTCSIYVLADV